MCYLDNEARAEFVVGHSSLILDNFRRQGCSKCSVKDIRVIEIDHINRGISRFGISPDMINFNDSNVFHRAFRAALTSKIIQNKLLLD